MKNLSRVNESRMFPHRKKAYNLITIVIVLIAHYSFFFFISRSLYLNFFSVVFRKMFLSVFIVTVVVVGGVSYFELS